MEEVPRSTNRAQSENRRLARFGQIARNPLKIGGLSGATRRDRTGDLLITNQRQATFLSLTGIPLHC
jgi:hypothetical protein